MIEKLDRRKIRYYCFRIQNNQSNIEKLDENIIKEFETIFVSQKYFDEWKNFSKTWDLSKNNPLCVVKIYYSNEEKWKNFIEENAIELK